MSRPVRIYTVTDSSRQIWVAARTKVAAAQRLSATLETAYRPTQVVEMKASWPGELVNLARAGVIDNVGGRDGRVAVYVRYADGEPVLTADQRRGTESLTVRGHWRVRDDRLAFVRIEIDPAVRPTRPVMVPAALGPPEHIGRGYGGERTSWPGNVATFTEHDNVWVGGVGEMPRAAAETLMSGLAGALAELDARESCPHDGETRRKFEGSILCEKCHEVIGNWRDDEDAHQVQVSVYRAPDGSMHVTEPADRKLHRS